jgi:polyhydroxyalkanoate synthesis regulator phasin
MELNDMPYLLLGALASVRDDKIKTVDDMIARGKDLAEGTKSKAKSSVQDKKLDATVKELVKKGKQESAELVDAVGKVVKDTLDSLGVVTKSDIKAVEKRLDNLEKKLSAAPAKKAAKKPAAKKAAKKPAVKKPAAKKPAKKAAKKA